uniref:Uncharacterized protein n=1 Tax=Alexandrium monilatum TaxID=311494 RepID=A0A7S4VST8_9DINO
MGRRTPARRAPFPPPARPESLAAGQCASACRSLAPVLLGGQGSTVPASQRHVWRALRGGPHSTHSGLWQQPCWQRLKEGRCAAAHGTAAARIEAGHVPKLAAGVNLCIVGLEGAGGTSVSSG